MNSAKNSKLNFKKLNEPQSRITWKQSKKKKKWKHNTWQNNSLILMTLARDLDINLLAFCLTLFLGAWF